MANEKTRKSGIKTRENLQLSGMPKFSPRRAISENLRSIASNIRMSITSRDREIATLAGWIVKNPEALSLEEERHLHDCISRLENSLAMLEQDCGHLLASADMVETQSKKRFPKTLKFRRIVLSEDSDTSDTPDF